MSLEENKAIIRRLIEAENKQNLTLLDELMAPDYIDHTVQLRGRESFKQIEREFYKCFPDFYETIEDIIAEGDKVWDRFKGTGTHKGEWSVPQALTSTGKKITLARTGKKITIKAVSIYRIVDGKVVEREVVADMLDFYKQLGVIEYKGFPEDVS